MVEGYKNTEVGVIPNDWNIKKLKEVAEFGSGTTPSRDLFQRYFQNGQYHWVKTMDLNNGEIHDTGEKVTAIALKEVSSLKIFPTETVLIAMYGGFNQIGRTGILKIKASTNQALTAIQPFKAELSSDFLIKYLNFKVDYWKDVASSSRKDPNITSKDVKEFPIILPTKAEQIAIATALNDADALINQLEQLLSKKRNIKIGATQELLRPKEGWEEKKLGEVAQFFKGKGLPKSDLTIDGEKKCIHYGELFLKYREQIVEVQGRANSFEGAFYSITNDVLMPTSDVTPNGLATASCINEDSVLLGGDVLIIRIPKEEVNGSFLSYYIKVNRNEIMKLVKGVTVFHLHASDMKGFVLHHPKINEQNKVANILFEMGNEILKLERKLEKYKMMKQGMMQNLLTGKIRLV